MPELPWLVVKEEIKSLRKVAILQWILSGYTKKGKTANSVMVTKMVQCMQIDQCYTPH